MGTSFLLRDGRGKGLVPVEGIAHTWHQPIRQVLSHAEVQGGKGLPVARHIGLRQANELRHGFFNMQVLDFIPLP